MVLLVPWPRNDKTAAEVLWIYHTFLTLRFQALTRVNSVQCSCTGESNGHKTKSVQCTKTLILVKPAPSENQLICQGSSDLIIHSENRERRLMWLNSFNNKRRNAN